MKISKLNYGRRIKLRFDHITYFGLLIVAFIALATDSLAIAILYVLLLLVLSPKVLRKLTQLCLRFGRKNLSPALKSTRVFSAESNLRSNGALSDESYLDDFLLSIIVPFTQQDALTLRLARQFSNLDLTDVQVIWVLNTKKDLRNLLTKEYFLQHPNATLLWEPKPGAGRARNLGLSQATGAWLWFIDSDDEIETRNWNYLKAQLQEFSNGVDIFLLGAEDVDFETRVARKPDWFLRKTLSSGLNYVNDHQHEIFQITHPAAWNKIFSRKLIVGNRISFGHTLTANDLPFTYSSISSAKTLRLLRDHVFYRYYRNRPSSLQTQSFSRTDRIKAVQTLGTYLIRSGKFMKTFKSFYRLLGRSFNPNLFSAPKKFDVPLSLTAKNLLNYSVSIIIPAYNAEKYISLTTESALSQTFKNIDLVVINDGSTDRTLNIIEEAAILDKRIRVFSQPNSGLSAARNLGLKNSLGDYIMFLDSDDTLREDAVEQCLNALHFSEAEVVLFDTVPFPDPDQENKSRVLKRSVALERYYARNIKELTLSGAGMLKHLLDNESYLQSSCLYLFKKEILEKHKVEFLEGIIMEDNLFTPQLFLSAASATYLKQVLHRRRVREDSISFERNVETTVSQLIVLTKFNGWCERNGFNSLAIQCEKRILNRLARVSFREVNSLSTNEQEAVVKSVGLDNVKILKDNLLDLSKLT
jgi:glycosyltransferase involved in cell wall biosynthesis